MRLQRIKNFSELRDMTFPFLLRNEAENSLGIGIIGTLVERPEVYPNAYTWILWDENEVKGVAWMTPPHPLGVTSMPPSGLKLLAQEMRTLEDPITGIVGPLSEATQLKDLWLGEVATANVQTIKTRLFEARKVVFPQRMPAGFMRLAAPAELPTISEWNYQFCVECNLTTARESAEMGAKLAIDSHTRFVWEREGEVVCMAGTTRPTPHGISIGFVYTPKQWRGHGFASALVATLSQQVFDAGKTSCFLYTDLANPTSNSIYQKLGYKPISDCAHFTFTQSGVDATIRLVKHQDNAALAQIIRTVMPEFGASGSGFAIMDAEVENMFAAYQGRNSRYYVLEERGRIIGGAGFGPLAGADPAICELRKMYFLPEARNRGWGRKLLKLCLDEARFCGFKQCYLETLSSMKAAHKLYEQFGFRKLEHALGQTGHFGCNMWFIRDLDGDWA